MRGGGFNTFFLWNGFSGHRHRGFLTTFLLFLWRTSDRVARLLCSLRLFMKISFCGCQPSLFHGAFDGALT